MSGEPGAWAAGGAIGSPRLSVDTVRRLHCVLAGDRQVEAAVLQYIAHHWGARNLFEVPELVAAAVLARHLAFIRAAREFCEPTLKV